MVTMTCKCGKSQMTFQRLSPADFPKGWNHTCCTEKLLQEMQEVQAGSEEVAVVEEPTPRRGRPKRG